MREPSGTPPALGSLGLTRLEYPGLLALARWRGPVTGARYPFGVRRRVGYVDRRDAPGLLARGFREVTGWPGAS